ncbi:MAG: urease subunit gamma [Nostocoides sp.]
MRLTPQERDRLLIASAAAQARRRRERGLLLNVPEAIALISDTVIEAARDGLRMPAVVSAGASALGAEDVLPGVADVVTEVVVEAVFDDGTRLVVVLAPFGELMAEARPSPQATPPGPLPPGAILPAPLPHRGPAPGMPKGTIEDDDVTVAVRNTASVAVTVTSHWHFFEANAALRFDRRAAYGMHLHVPAGTGVRFEPGELVTVALAPIGGARVAIGFAGLVDGPLDAAGARDAALARAIALGYRTCAEGETP